MFRVVDLGNEGPQPCLQSQTNLLTLVKEIRCAALHGSKPVRTTKQTLILCPDSDTNSNSTLTCNRRANGMYVSRVLKLWGGYRRLGSYSPSSLPKLSMGTSTGFQHFSRSSNKGKFYWATQSSFSHGLHLFLVHSISTGVYSSVEQI